MLLSIGDNSGQLVAKRFQKAFDCDTRILVQVKGAGTIRLCKEQGEAQNPADGFQITQASTASPIQPFEFIWQGELWYNGDTAGQQFVLIVIGPVGGSAKGPQKSS